MADDRDLDPRWWMGRRANDNDGFACRSLARPMTDGENGHSWRFDAETGQST